MAIGETFLGAALQVLFDRLASQQVLNFFTSSKIDQSLVDELTDKMRRAEQLLADAEQKQNSDDKVKSWLDDIQHLIYRAEEIADQIETEAKRSSMDLSPVPKSFKNKVQHWISVSSSSSSFASTVNSQISEVVAKLDRKVELSRDLKLLSEVSVNVNTTSSRATTSRFPLDEVVFGRDQEKEKLLNLLFSEEAERNRIGIVAIVGMGGMGKTTLAKLAYNHERLKAFDLKAWVYVSDQFDIFRVLKSILESITRQPYSGSLELDVLDRELSEKLKGKRFFLVLDDVWNEKPEEWDRLRAPLTFGNHGSKIIVTTRKDRVANIMCTDSMIRLERLPDEDSWLLFSKHAFANKNLHSDRRHLESIGREIVRKCQGLPLAIKTLGSLLWSKEGINEWEAIRESNLWGLLDSQTNVAPALRLSYHYLPSHLKRCFSYCSIFPKGYRFDRQKLVLLWMAENFVKPIESGRRMEDIGEDYLKQLLSCSFFERSGDSVVMHDLMHDLAEAVSGEFVARLEHGDEASRISEKARYFSFFQDEFDTSSKFEGLLKAKYIRAFVLLQGRRQSLLWSEVSEPIFYLSNEILQFNCLHVLSLSNSDVLELPKSIENLKQLRYLDVSGTPIKELPESVSTLCNLQSLLLSGCTRLERLPAEIENLKQLRYLDVSGTPIKELPESVSTLCNLQSLLLSGCTRLERLPAEMSRLVSLRHLHLSGTKSLRQMPKDMSKLKHLQTLSGFVVGKHRGHGIEELRDLRHIRGKLALRSLQNISSPDGALDANLSGMEYIKELVYVFDDGDNDDSRRVGLVLENLRPCPNLERLAINNYPGTQFPSWLDTQCSMFKKIVSLTLNSCKNCCLLPSLGQLPSLKELYIRNMDNIGIIEHELYGCDSGLMDPFPALRRLVLENMKNWEEWSGHDKDGIVCFACLEELRLSNCPKLKGDLPANVWSGRSLKVLEIRGCESLNLSVLQQPSVQGSQVSTFHLSPITKLYLTGLKQLVSLPAEVGMLACLETLYLGSCDNLKSLENVRLPTSLQSLKISNCKMLESLPKEMELLNNLQSFNLEECPCVKCGGEDTLPTSLQDLSVESCERWELPIPIERMHCYSALRDIWMVDSGDSSFPIGAFPNLKELRLGELRELERVYIPAGVDPLNLTSLQQLYLSDCLKLKWAGKTEEEGVVDLPAPNLQTLGIVGCDMVKPFLRGDREGLPSQLQTLLIDLHSVVSTKASSQRNTRNLLMFSCLTDLRIWGHHLAECFPEKGVSLPVSITDLSLIKFPNLKYLNGEALKTLTSLQKLDISDCPKLECLPEEGLPASLRGLRISRCPILKERCQRSIGLDWPKIRHVPRVWIDYNLI